MGFLTTITIYNDSADQLNKYPEDLAQKLTDACAGKQINRGFNWDDLGNASNILTLQKPRHMDDNTLYMHAGNTVIDVYDADSEWAINQFISEMKFHIKRLEKILDKNKKDEDRPK